MPESLDHILGKRGLTVKGRKALSQRHGSAVWRVQIKTGNAILKLGPAENISAEVWGLKSLTSVVGVSAPEVVDTWSEASKGFLLMEHIVARSATDKDMAALGEMVAILHGKESGHFGLERNNFIGSLNQVNTPMSSWSDFWWERRIDPQLKLAKTRGYDLLHAYPDIESRIRSSKIVQEVHQGSLLHGDLWNGNYLIREDGRPFLIDPCPYYGDPRVDLAMTRLFGGFSLSFYDAYHRAASHELEFTQEVCVFYQLYFQLNHLNMFGSAYLGGVKACLDAIR